MTVYGLTDDGFVLKPLNVIVQEIRDYQLANVDPGLDQDDRDPLQQINSSHAAPLAFLWELCQAVYNAAYPDGASGASLVNVSSITGTTPNALTKTLVEDVDVTLEANKALPAGSVAHLSSQPNARFVSLADVPADPGGGTFPVDFEAETAGAIVVAAWQLDQIAEPVSGWTNVDNSTAGVTGTEIETDSELRQKRLDELEGGGSTNVDSIRANLLQDVDGVVDAAVFENDTDVAVGGLLPHSVHCILRGGASADIAQSIFATKSAGIYTNGAELESILDSQGVAHPTRFDYATELDYYMEASIETNPLLYDSVGGEAAMQAAAAAYVNALGVGADVIVDGVRCALRSVTGVIKITALVHGFAPSPVGTGDLTVATDEYVVSDTANIDLTIT